MIPLIKTSLGWKLHSDENLRFIIPHLLAIAAKLVKRLDCVRLRSAFGRTKLYERPRVLARKSGGEPSALQTLRDH